MTDRGVLFEFVQLGNQMRVAAIDEATAIEVVVIAPLRASRADMQRLALAKLRRKIDEKGPAGPQPQSGKYA